MANELLYSSSSIVLSQVLHQEMGLLLADRASLEGHPAILDVSDLTGRGSATILVPLVGLLGFDEMTAVGAETADAGNVAVTDAAPTITIARYAIAREVSDLHQIVEGTGLSVERLAQSMVMEYEMAKTSLICGVLDDFTSTVGTSGVDLDVSDIEDAIHTLERANANGPFASVLAPVQVTDFQKSLALRGGAIQMMSATAEMLEAKGQGYVGNFLGVDFFKSDKVKTANAAADRAGAVFAAGAVGCAYGSPSAVSLLGGSHILPAGAKVMVEFERSAKGGRVDIVGSAYMGVSILQDGMGVSVITDA